jgi:selenocysteine lyase/cysteine desulfurase
MAIYAEKHFSRFRDNIIGIDASFESPFGVQKIVYGDWIASGRLYRTIEEKLSGTFGPFIGNTHTETSYAGSFTTHCYHLAHQKIKQHCNAGLMM